MTTLTRRSLLRSSVWLATAGALARPYIANAAATTATVWWVQGFAQTQPSPLAVTNHRFSPFQGGKTGGKPRISKCLSNIWSNRVESQWISCCMSNDLAARNGPV